ncbi:MAG TPA: hypothetical protein VNQ73_03135 [Ilumatobacter sp.]|nr:hypothetical protein [Ilumatobacter sp.]
MTHPDMNPVEDQLADYFTWLDTELAHPEPTGRPRSAPGHHAWWLAAAATVALLVTGLVVIARRPADTPPTGAPAPPGVTALPDSSSPDSSPPASVVVPWTGPPSQPLEGTTSCISPDTAGTLADRAFAFDGTVVKVGTADRDDLVVHTTFEVHEWFRSGTTAPPTVTVDMLPPELTSYGPAGLDGAPATWGLGSRLLITGEPRFGGEPLLAPVAWMCGFSRTYDPTTAAEWRATFATATAAGWFSIDLPDAERLDVQADTKVVDGPAGFYAWGDLDHEPIRTMSLFATPPLAPDEGEVGQPEGARIDGAPDGTSWELEMGDRDPWLQWRRADGTGITVRGTGVTTGQLAEWMFAIGGSADLASHPDPAMTPLPADMPALPGYVERWRVGTVQLQARALAYGPGVILTQGFDTIEHREIDGQAGFVARLPSETALIWPIDADYWAVVEVPEALADRLDEIIAAVHVRRPAETDAVITTAPPFTVPPPTVSNPAPTPTGGPLQRVLAEEGVDTGTAPEAVRDSIAAVALGTDHYCGIDRRPQGSPQVTNEAARRCFLDRHLVGIPAVFVETFPTSEGDPIVTVWRTHADGTVSQLVDSTRDRYGPSGWEQFDCPSVTTHFPDATIDLPPTLFQCSDEGTPRLTGAGFPEWWHVIPPTATCGYSGPAETAERDLLGIGWECFAAARERGEPVELVQWTESPTGRVVHWWRSVIAEGEPFVQHVTWTNEPGPAGAGWRLWAGCTLSFAPGERLDVPDWGAQSSCSDGTTGTVAGSLALVGGPAPGVSQPVAGTVSLRQQLPPNGTGTPWLANADLTTGTDGTFEFVVPVGTYEAWGMSPSYGAGICTGAGESVTVSAGETVTIDLECRMR